MVQFGQFRGNETVACTGLAHNGQKVLIFLVDHVMTQLIRNRNALLRWYSMALLAAAAIVLFAFQWRAAVSVPFSDEFGFTSLYEDLMRDGYPGMRTLGTAYNGHIYSILYLLIWAVLFIGIPWKCLMFSQVVLLLGTAVVALRNIDSAGKWWSIAGATTAVVISVVSIRMWENLYWGMQISAALGLLFAFLSFDQAGRYEGRKQDAAYVCRALLFAFLALGSTGSGIIAMAVVCAWMGFKASARRNLPHLFVVAIAAVLAAGLYTGATQIGSVHGDDVRPYVPDVANHGLHMLAHAVVDLEGKDPLARWVGFIVAGVTGAAGWFCLKNQDRRGQAFSFLLMVYAVLTIAGISWARMKMGIWQPNASRYYLYVLPLAVGIFLALANSRSIFGVSLMFGMLLTVAANLVVAVDKEWGTSPYRKGNMEIFRAELCSNQLEGADRPFNLADQPLRKIRVLYCRPEIMK